MTSLFNLGLAATFAALVCLVAFLLFRRPLLEFTGRLLMAGGWGFLTAYIGWRWVEAGRPPFANTFESLVLFAWAVLLVSVGLWRRKDIPWFGVASAALASVALAHASTYESDVKPLVPALQSNWLTVHVITCLLGYGGFAVAFLMAGGYLVLDRRSSPVPAGRREALMAAMARTIEFGYLFLTLGIVTGSVWANTAWGTYWSWDPKETWSLITWLVYAAFLHGRFVRGWSPRRAAWLAILGFLSVLFTWFGVNYLLSGLHSYG